VAAVGLGYHRVRFTNEENLYTILPLNMAFGQCYIPLIAAIKGSSKRHLVRFLETICQ
jgi:hypothetical protein